VCVPTLSGKEFSTRVVDGLGRPLPGVVVEVAWHKQETEGKMGLGVSILKLHSDENGTVRGSFDEKSLTGDGFTSVELSKDGYNESVVSLSSFLPKHVPQRLLHVGPFQPEYVLKRVFHDTDIARIANLQTKARTPGLKELMAGVWNEEELERGLFKMDHAFRPVLRDLVRDARFQTEAIRLLAIIGEPEDLQWIAQHTRAPRKKWLEDSWAYDVVSAMLEPTTEMQWAFLKKCASGEYDEPDVNLDVTGGAILALKFIASPRSRQILEELRPKDEDLALLATEAIAYVESKPAPLSDRNLIDLGKRVAAAVKVGNWRGNRAPEFNERRDKAFIDLDFSEGTETFTWTATFQVVGGLWKLRGVRLTHSNPGVPLGSDETDKKK